MDKEKQLKIIADLQKAVEQMQSDDIEETPDAAYDIFECSCCGCEKIMAGSVMYKDYLLCNDCVLKAEIAFALNKIDDIQELIDSMEEQRLENICNSLNKEKEKSDN